VLGVARLEWLGYGDSGSDVDPRRRAPAATDQPTGPTRFVDAPVDEAAARLARILLEEHADALTSYDPNGGYGHPDHVQVHRVGALAARQAGTPLVLEATIDRDLMRLGVDLARTMGYAIPPQFTPDTFDMWYTPAEAITHTVDVRAHLAQKKAAMQAHASQATSAEHGGTRTIDLFLGLPDDLFATAFGTEWFVDRGHARDDGSSELLDDVLASPESIA